MNLYKFELTVNGFTLRVHFSPTEESGLKWCKRIASQFQKNVANLEIKVTIHKKENQKHAWEYHGKPYMYHRTLSKKPLTKKNNLTESPAAM
ncbi:hypothetical protein J2W91_004679 [Paenibacillus amylolyticus]|uniref:Uncharacterized protein n=1 Tax=Paenibacillus amylolyticus TaxID=1451 RepID=A0AAP5H4G4_PAEAM|nr:hypothetical protein [Paenibacillus amylolyticus]MDR6726173.1 hypothetical protein [Paenibacillus amylolyticus]